jgi:hypothetical protein
MFANQVDATRRTSDKLGRSSELFGKGETERFNANRGKFVRWIDTRDSGADRVGRNQFNWVLINSESWSSKRKRFFQMMVFLFER